MRPLIFGLIALSAAGTQQAVAEPIRIEFVGSVPDSLKAELLASAPSATSPQSPLQNRRDAKRAANRFRDTLNSNGYFDPKIEIAPDQDQPGNQVIRVETGPIFKIAAINIEFIDRSPNDDDRASILLENKIKPNDPAIPADIIAAERHIVLALQARGYAFASAKERRIQGKRDEAVINVTYRIASGSRIQIGESNFPSDMRTKKNI